MGLPVEELVPVTAEVMPGIKVSEMFSPRFYRNHNNELKVTLDAPLAVPEYEHEEYKMMFSTQEKAALERGGTLERLIKHKDPLTGEEEWCFVGKNAATNRLVFQPKREVAAAICKLAVEQLQQTVPEKICRLQRDYELCRRILRIIDGETFSLEEMDKCRIEIMHRYPSTKSR